MTANVSRHYLAATLLTLAVSGASADIRWLEKDFDFGLMREEAGPQTGSSRFVNLGPDTVSIFSVKPSCGCTSADFSDAPLAPGDTAVISYTYDPHMRPGKFDKSVKVRLSDASRHTIRITGNVLGTSESVATLFPVDAGDLRMSESVVNAGEVTMGRSPLLFVNAYSMPLDSIRPTLSSPDEALVISPSSPTIGAGEVVAFSFNFDSRKYGRYGPVEIPVTITPDPASEREPFTLRFKAFVVPDPKRLLATQKGRNPRASLDSDIITINCCPTASDGSGKQNGKPVSVTFTLSNSGTGPLEVLCIAPASEAVSAGKPPKPVKPGRHSDIRLDIHPHLLPQGSFRIPVDIITDDPDHPRRTIHITGENKP